MTGADLPPDFVDGVRDAWTRERPDLDVRTQGVFGRLSRVAIRVTDELVAVYRQHGLAEGDFDVLATLRRAGEPYAHSCGELAEHTLVTSGGMTKRVDRLEGAGLVRRRVSEHDGRGRVVELTDRGREVIDAAFTDHIANQHRLLAMLDPGDAEVLEDVLKRWLARLEDLPPTS
ncbi:MarR family winged helix-turn-helix transcriptional regulator [Cellulomonas sp. NPDC057328]|uniref:MarR family winged helix-turn-helix transcriptional regulator n=1 Tax=Cellulomonas sp. NPDC057328 TaxID=3346101 RepID=UPI0036421CD9